MNIHPAFVHFPIALLTLYALMTLIPLARLFPRIGWNQVRYFLLYAGTLSIFPTIITGIIAAQLAGVNVVLPYHKAAAATVLLIFCIASGFALRNQFRPMSNQRVLDGVQKVLAVLGLAALFTVGALGAAMVYGYTTDPIVSFITHVLGLH